MNIFTVGGGTAFVKHSMSHRVVVYMLCEQSIAAFPFSQQDLNSIQKKPTI